VSNPKELRRTVASLVASLAVVAPQMCRAETGASGQGVFLAQAEAPKLFHGTGTITAIDAPSGVVTLNHDAIPGLMDAMEMQFEAKPSTILEGLKIGDKVTFTLDGKNWALLAIGRRPEAK
jgi:Cu(I)/Ag(I) efflux system periplasmic protein CusF